MSATGKDVSGATNNTPTFISALVLGVVVFSVFIVFFFVFHGRARKSFQPRLDHTVASKRPNELPSGVISWFKTIAVEPNSTILKFNGPDAYFFLRYIRLILFILLPFWFLTWAILFPLSALGGAGLPGLNMFTFGNIVGSKQNYHIGHLLLGVLFIVYILYMLHAEYKHYFEIRSAYLSSPEHLASARSRTVIATNLPADWMEEQALRKFATSFTQGTIEHVWLARKVDKIADIYDERAKACLTLEAGEASVQKTAVKRTKKETTPEHKNPSGVAEDTSIIARYVPAKDRPTHRLGLPLISKKVDTLEFTPVFIHEQNVKLEAERANFAALPLGNSAFIRFTSQAAAQEFCKAVSKKAGTKMVNATGEVIPEEVIWGNLAVSPYVRIVKTTISWALTIFLMIIWAPLVAFVGVISNINTLQKTVPFLSFISKIPSVVQGIIQGILPPVALVVLFMVLPMFLRFLIKFQGTPRESEVERKLFARFWIFQVLHGFLIVTVASGLTTALRNISASTVSQLPTSLATNLPGASVFFLTFIVSTSLSSAGKTNARLVPLIMSKLAFILRGGTPRKAYNYDFKLAAIQLSTTWPPVALLGCMSIVYAIIQPVIVGFGVVAFAFMYITYKYLLIWVLEQSRITETGGLMYNKALNTIFTSVYLTEICLAGLFFLQKENADGTGGQSKLGLAGGAIFAALLVATAIFQILLQRKYSLLKLKYASGALDSPANGSESNLVAERQHSEGAAGAPYGETSGLHANAFDHPATWKPQPVIWIANDSFGIGLSEVARLEAENVAASTAYAVMDAEGHLTVQRCAPDVAWYGENIDDKIAHEQVIHEKPVDEMQ